VTYPAWMAVEPINDEDPRLWHPKCGRWMPIAREHCYRWPGHRTKCRTQFAVEYSRIVQARNRQARKANARNGAVGL